jgi:hypothetical protein
MGIVEYKLEKGCICLTPCPALMKKSDGDFVLVGSTACMLCVSNRKMTFFEDESGGVDPRLPKMNNVVLTPHVAWNTAEAVVAIHEEVAANVAKYLRGERPDSIVNKL